MIFRPEARRWRAANAGLPLAILAMVAIAPALSAASGVSATAQAIGAGRVALVKGDGISAEVDLRRALDTGAKDDEVAALMGEAYLLQKDYDSARRWLGPENFVPEQRRHGFHMLARL